LLCGFSGDSLKVKLSPSATQKATHTDFHRCSQSYFRAG